MSGEAASRADPDLPGQQRALAQAVFERARARNVHVIVILFSGRPLLVTWLAEQADALLAAWFLGSEAGNAVSDIVTGRRAPSGRTPITWPRALGQVPVFFAQRPSGRPFNSADHYTSRYLDVPNEPLYPFGHGLTYTQFEYANLRVTPESVSESDTIEARVELSNIGPCAGEETLFLFTHDKVASVAPPLLGTIAGDHLVRSQSAAGRGRSRRIPFDAEHGLTLSGLNHFDLLNHPLVYAKLRDWLAQSPSGGISDMSRDVSGDG